MKKMIQLTLTLTIIAAIAGVSISSVYEKTKDVISAQKEEQLNSALESLFPDGVAISEDSITLQDGKKLTFWIAEKTDFMNGSPEAAESEGKVLGYAFEGGQYGYSSVVKYIAAVKANGTILGVSILSQEETPGLGSRSTESVSTATFWNGLFKKRIKTTPWFQEQFRGLSILDTIGIADCAEWHTLTESEKEKLIYNNEVSAITGATITTKAVTDALVSQSAVIKEIAEYLSSNGGMNDK